VDVTFAARLALLALLVLATPSASAQEDAGVTNDAGRRRPRPREPRPTEERATDPRASSEAEGAPTSMTPTSTTSSPSPSPSPTPPATTPAIATPTTATTTATTPSTPSIATPTATPTTTATPPTATTATPPTATTATPPTTTTATPTTATPTDAAPSPTPTPAAPPVHHAPPALLTLPDASVASPPSAPSSPTPDVAPRTSSSNATATPAPAAPADRAPAPILVQTERTDRFDLGAEVAAIFETLTGERTTLGFFSLALTFALAILLALALRRVRESLPDRGLIPTSLAFLHLTLRLVAVAILLLLALRILPPRLSVVALFTLVAVAVALGWSVRDFLPDLVAGFVVVFERRVRRGTWISAPGFSGQVERLGFRSTLLRDAQGRRVDVPNRHLLSAPVTSGGHHEREHEVEVHLDATLPASVIRAALRDAVLASPWVFPGADAVVLRDPDEPRRWRVRGRLLEGAFGARFEGELLERVEALLPGAITSSMAGLVVLPAPETPNTRTDPIDPPSRTRRAPDDPEVV
jgi:small-conductance mechanosensitive channel